MRIGEQLDGDAGALALPTAQRADPDVGLLGQAHGVDHVFAGAVLEMGTRPGPVKERIAAFQGGFTGQIRQFIVTALERHELPADEDPDALTFELNGIILAANTHFVLHEDPAALDMARNIVRRRLGIATTV